MKTIKIAFLVIFLIIIGIVVFVLIGPYILEKNMNANVREPLEELLSKNPSLTEIEGYFKSQVEAGHISKYGDCKYEPAGKCTERTYGASYRVGRPDYLVCGRSVELYVFHFNENMRLESYTTERAMHCL